MIWISEDHRAKPNKKIGQTRNQLNVTNGIQMATVFRVFFLTFFSSKQVAITF